MHCKQLFIRINTWMAVLALGMTFVLSGQAYAQEQQPQQVTPDIQNATCQGAELQFKQGPLSGNECQFNNGSTAPEEKLNQLVASVVNLFSVVVGVVSVIMIIYGGFRYIISGGDTGNVTSAKNTILYAIIGLVIVAFAQFIVKFVLAKAAGVGA